MTEIDVFINYLQIFKSIMNSNKDFIDMIQKYSDDRNLSNTLLLSEFNEYDDNKIKFINEICVATPGTSVGLGKTFRSRIIRYDSFFFENIKSGLKLIFHPMDDLKIECFLTNAANHRCSITMEHNNIVFSYGKEYNARSRFDITDIFNMDFNDPSFNDIVKESYLLYKLEYTSVYDITGANKAFL